MCLCASRAGEGLEKLMKECNEIFTEKFVMEVKTLYLRYGRNEEIRKYFDILQQDILCEIRIAYGVKKL